MDHTESSESQTNNEIVFNDTWYVWYHHELDDWTSKGYKKIFTIRTMEDFWNFFNNFACLGGINLLHYFVMRAGVVPIYEDPRNKNGGTWSSLVAPQYAEEDFTMLSTAIIGESLCDKNSSIMGFSSNIKSGLSVIKIWNNNKSENSVKLLKDIDNILKHKQGQIIYKQHPK